MMLEAIAAWGRNDVNDESAPAPAPATLAEAPAMKRASALEDLDLVDPERVLCRLPQPYRSIVKVLESVLECAWVEIESRHPEISKAGSHGGVKRVARPAWSAACDAEPFGAAACPETCPVVTQAASVCLLERRGTAATLTPLEIEEAQCVAVSGLGGTRLALAATGRQLGNDDENLKNWVAVVEIDELRLATLVRFETPEAVTGLALSDDGLWLCVSAAGGNAAVHSLPDRGGEMASIGEEAAVDWQAALELVATPVFSIAAPGDQSASAVCTAFLGVDEAVCVWPGLAVIRKYSLRRDGDSERPSPAAIVAEWFLGASVTCLTIASDEATAAVGFGSGAVCVWDFQLDCCRHCLKRHRAPIAAVAFHAVRYLASAAVDASVRVYDLAPEIPVLIASRNDLPRPAGPVSLVALAGAPLAVLRAGDDVVVYDLADAQRIGSLERVGQLVAAGDVVVVLSKTADVYSTDELLRQLKPDEESPLPSPTHAATEVNFVFAAAEDTDALVHAAIRDACENRASRELQLDQVLKAMRKRLPP